MNKPTDIEPTNDKYQRHGYWERYHENGNLFYKGNYINEDEDGYWEEYGFNGVLYEKTYYIR